jgi:hypothetical protein
VKGFGVNDVASLVFTTIELAVNVYVNICQHKLSLPFRMISVKLRHNTHTYQTTSQTLLQESLFLNVA